MALAHALQPKPDRPFLDGTAASLDPAAEARFYELLKERLPGAALVSIALRPNLARHHRQALRVGRGRDGFWPGRCDPHGRPSCRSAG
jgi:putative ATP-binding cassette transporter